VRERSIYLPLSIYILSLSLYIYIISIYVHDDEGPEEGLQVTETVALKGRMERVI